MLPDLSMLMQQCAPNVGQVTMRALIRTESGGNPFILADAGPSHLPWSKRESLVRTLRPRSAAEAAEAARALLAQGHIVAIGLTQINAINLPRYGLTIEQVLDPCTNISTGAKILADDYARALRKFGHADPQAALQAALSAYWSGNFVNGFAGGYVQKVINNAGLAVELKVPSLASGRVVAGPLGKVRIDRTGQLTPYTAPLQATGFGVRQVAVHLDPRRAPLEAPGFGPPAGQQQ